MKVKHYYLQALTLLTNISVVEGPSLATRNGYQTRNQECDKAQRWLL